MKPPSRAPIKVSYRIRTDPLEGAIDEILEQIKSDSEEVRTLSFDTINKEALEWPYTIRFEETDTSSDLADLYCYETYVVIEYTEPDDVAEARYNREMEEYEKLKEEQALEKARAKRDREELRRVNLQNKIWEKEVELEKLKSELLGG